MAGQCWGSGKEREAEFLLYSLSGHCIAILSTQCPSRHLGVIITCCFSLLIHTESIIRPLPHSQFLLYLVQATIISPLGCLSSILTGPLHPFLILQYIVYVLESQSDGLKTQIEPHQQTPLPISFPPFEWTPIALPSSQTELASPFLTCPFVYSPLYCVFNHIEPFFSSWIGPG